MNCFLKCQKNNSYCVPAVVQGLLAFQGIKVTQAQIVAAAGAQATITKQGMRSSQIAHAVSKLAPDLNFWYKQETTAEDIDVLIHQYHLPVGVNWQGLFYPSVEAERAAHDFYDRGHFSVILDIDPENDQITLNDPYHTFFKHPRQFLFHWFASRWYDTDRLITADHHKIYLPSRKLIFVLTPKNIVFPSFLQLLPPEHLFRHEDSLKSNYGSENRTLLEKSAVK